MALTSNDGVWIGIFYFGESAETTSFFPINRFKSLIFWFKLRLGYAAAKFIIKAESRISMDTGEMKR